MSDKFFNTSKQIANEFLQSILFIDDQAYREGDKSNEFDPFEISKVFATEQKICSVLNPTKESDLKNIKQIAIKADVIVIDWRLDLERDKELEENEEEDDVDDHRGAYTLNFIKNIILDPLCNTSLKMIVIYTGETNLIDITDKVYKEINSTQKAVKGNFKVSGTNFKILIAGKSSLAKVRVKEIKEQAKSYKDLPDFLLDEFTKLTSGLVSNVALKAITSIRKNNFKILQLYNKQMDPAFLSHRAMLSVPDDAGELLKDSIINSFDAIIDYDRIEEFCSYKHIKDWFANYSFLEQQIRVQKKDLKINIRELKYWQQEGFLKAVKGIWSRQFPNIDLDVHKIQTKYKDIHKDWSNYFVPDGFEVTEHNERFSILTHHKSNFANPTYTPKLTLGTVFKGKKSGKYWLCIQQKCDSVRIPTDEERRFLFLTLLEIQDNGKFNFLIENENDYIKLKIDFSSHKLRTIKFKSNKDGMVLARRYGNSQKYFFHPIYFKSGSNQTIHQNYIWVMDLKDSHAQRVANHYASVLARVGLDESEWLRRWST